MRYLIEASSSRCSVRAFAGGPLAAVGHNPTFLAREFEGEVEFDSAEPAAASLRLVIKAASLSLSDNMSDKDRREIEHTTQNDVLESGRFPEIIYDCPSSRLSAVGPMQLTLNGDLTLHGVTRPQQVLARVYLTGTTMRAQGEATVRQADFGIRPMAVAGGMLKVKDELKLTFDIVARAAPADAAVDAGTRRSGAEPCVT